MLTSFSRAAARAGATIGLACAVSVLAAGVASAHITTTPSTVERGEYNQIGFRVPNESESASTVKVELTLPTDTPISEVRTLPMPGWTAKVTTAKLDKPVTVNNADVVEAARTVTWTATSGGIRPGEFGLFDILTGVLPDNTDTLVIPTAQTYSDGKVVNWDQPTEEGGEEPEFPAVIVNLTGEAEEGHGAAEAPADEHSDEATGHDETAGEDHAADAAAQDDTARWLAGAGLVVGALGVGFGVGAMLRARRRPAASAAGTASDDHNTAG